MPYQHLTPMERGQIEALKNAGLGVRAVSRQLGRSPSTISRELARNGGEQGRYRAESAQKRYQEMRAESRRKTSLSHQPLWDYVVDKIGDGWSPEQVSGRLWLDFPGQPRMRISHETVYRNIYADERLRSILLPCLRQRRPRRRKRGERRAVRPVIPNRLGIELRPPEVDTLERYGDWEGDLVVGASQKGAVLTLVERKSLRLVAGKTPSRHAEGVAAAAIEALKAVGSKMIKTITFDNGSEFAKHETMAQALEADIYFAHPYSAYERGRNENTNGLLRQYLPKGTSFEHLSQEELQRIVDELNNRPRKKLGYRTPLEIFNEAVALEP